MNDWFGSSVVSIAMRPASRNSDCNCRRQQIRVAKSRPSLDVVVPDSVRNEP
jgi:hypothetical protein